ncbi:hypothetical protein V1477_003871 [Vespula maculifrons]|uniref:Uncharacterized protein n=2 Tax=Vespula TaxID=7451 RepID=A0A834KKK2_VESVU|nr:hypothetical protein HZH66_002892 [Vespula vulgaris]
MQSPQKKIDPIRYPRCLRETNKCRYQPHSGSSGEASPNAVTPPSMLEMTRSQGKAIGLSIRLCALEFESRILVPRVGNCSRTGYQPTPILPTPYHQQHTPFSDDLCPA